MDPAISGYDTNPNEKPSMLQEHQVLEENLPDTFSDIELETDSIGEGKNIIDTIYDGELHLFSENQEMEEISPGIPLDSELQPDSINEGKALIESMMDEEFDEDPTEIMPEAKEIDQSRDDQVQTPPPYGTGLEMVVAEPIVMPDWLPEGWSMEVKVRTSGATAGTKDRYYYDPISHRRFRSKKEVFAYIETGTISRSKSRSKTVHPDNDLESTLPHKKGGSSSKKKMKPPKFDFVNRPEMVRWVLSDSSETMWTPFIDNEVVPESSKISWTAAFEFITSGGPNFDG